MLVLIPEPAAARGLCMHPNHPHECHLSVTTWVTRVTCHQPCLHVLSQQLETFPNH
jgi:hypothetical protein